jgi:4-amino-4-deoxy-L-arabinose transferase-like glycosyltransferase
MSLAGRLDECSTALRRVPSAAWLCAVIACVNAVCWSLITPPFQVVDEPEHIAYVKQLADTGRLPKPTGEFSREEAVALRDLRLQRIAEEPQNRTIAAQAQQVRLERDLRVAEATGDVGDGYAGVAASEPPLYYALEVIPYALGAGGTLLDRIELMRVLSAVMGGLTALFAFMFVREALPGSRRAWTVGGLAVALAPMLGLMCGAVNPDSMLYAVSAALFYGLARAFRRGLTRRSALVLGAVIAVGLLTKLNFVGMVPGALLGLVVLSVRAARSLGRSAYVSLALALAVAVSPAALYVIVHLVTGALAFGIVSSAIGKTRGSVLEELSYIWQLYLPRLPGMRADFAGVLTTRAIWFDGYMGLFGWLDTPFPAWVYDVALVPAGVLVVLCVRSLFASIGALRARRGELVVYGVICVGLMGLIGGDSYLVFPRVDAEFGQVRYLLPLLALLAGVVALGVRGAGRRWGPVLGVCLVVVFVTQDVLGQLQEVARFYG